VTLSFLRGPISFRGIKASGNIPQSAVLAFQDAVDAWEIAIDSRESVVWIFDLVAFGSTSTTVSAVRSPLFSHNPNFPSVHGGGGGGGGGNGNDKPDIQIQLKKGGGLNLSSVRGWLGSCPHV